MQRLPGLPQGNISAKHALLAWQRVQSLPRVAPRLLNQPRTSTRERAACVARHGSARTR